MVWMLITRNQDITIEKWEINAPNSVGELGSDTEGEEIVGDDDRDSILEKNLHKSTTSYEECPANTCKRRSIQRKGWLSVFCIQA